MRKARWLVLYFVLTSLASCTRQPNASGEPDPRSVEANNRGVDKLEKGDTDGAIAEFTKAIELNPQYAKAYDGRGIARFQNGDTDGAIAEFTKAIELNPQYASAYNNRGVARAAKGDLDGAITDYTKEIEINGQNAGAYGNRGIVRLHQHKDAEAQKDFDQDLKLKPSMKPTLDSLIEEAKKNRAKKPQ